MSKAQQKRRWSVVPKEELDGAKTNYADAASLLKRKESLGLAGQKALQETQEQKREPESVPIRKKGPTVHRMGQRTEQSRFPVLAFAFQKLLEKQKGPK